MEHLDYLIIVSTTISSEDFKVFLNVLCNSSRKLA